MIWKYEAYPEIWSRPIYTCATRTGFGWRSVAGVYGGPQTALDLIASPNDAKVQNLIAVEKLFNTDLDCWPFGPRSSVSYEMLELPEILQDILEMLVKSAKEKRIVLTNRGSVDPKVRPLRPWTGTFFGCPAPA